MSNFLIQSSFGTAGNFKAVIPGGVLVPGSGGLVHLWRNNDDSSLPWSADPAFATDLENIGGVGLIQSNYTVGGNPGNFEVIVVANGELLHFSRNSATFEWIPDPDNPIASRVSGWPAIIQSSFGTVGNFEVVVPSSNFGLLHFWRNNDAEGTPPWSAPTSFGQVIDEINQQWGGASLIQSSFGNLEVVATPEFGAGEVSHFWRDSSNNWNFTTGFGESITGTASLIQSNFGSTGNFEVVAPFNFVQAFVHWWRNNDASGFPWATTGSFTKGGPGEGPPGPYAGMGLIQSRIDNSLVAAAYPSSAPSGGLDIYIRTGALFELSTTAA